jgi:hypothetical protein
MQPGDIIFQAPDGAKTVERAREFCKVRRLGADDVRLVKKDGSVMVIVKRECVCYVGK